MEGAEVAAAVVCVVEVPGLVGTDQLAAAAGGDLAGGDEWFELAASCDVCVGVTAGVAACLALLPLLCRAHARRRAAEPAMSVVTSYIPLSGPQSGR